MTTSLKHLANKCLHHATMLATLTLAVSPLLAGPPIRVAAAIWAHGELYDTIATDTAFKAPPHASTDVIYSFADSGLAGQRSVSAAAPGDPDFNGGRWSVKVVVFTDEGMTAHDPDADGMVNFELTSAHEVLIHQELGHLVILDTDVYFECPLLPRR